MRYRIKIITYKTGKTVYLPQVKAFIGWIGTDLIECNGVMHHYEISYDNRDRALKCIDRHYEYSKGKQTIEFEYITKE